MTVNRTIFGALGVGWALLVMGSHRCPAVFHMNDLTVCVVLIGANTHADTFRSFALLWWSLLTGEKGSLQQTLDFYQSIKHFFIFTCSTSTWIYFLISVSVHQAQVCTGSEAIRSITVPTTTCLQNTAAKWTDNIQAVLTCSLKSKQNMIFGLFGEICVLKVTCSFWA